MFNNTKLDHCDKIHYLTLIIKNLCEENNINKYVVIEDFTDMMTEEIKEGENA